MMWALMGSALIGLVGLTVDFTRAQAIRAQLQNAADGAALVAERSSNLSLAQRRAAAEAFFNAEMGDLAGDATITVTPLSGGGHRVVANMPMPVSLARLINSEDWDIDVAAEAQASVSPPLEVALVLDNTGSMSNDMDALRDAADDFANEIYNLAVLPNDIKFALVPFVAQVNIGNGATQMAWMDTAGTNPHHGEWFEDRPILYRPDSNGSGSGGNCNNTSTYPQTINGYNVRWVRTPSEHRCYAYQGSNSAINVFTLYNNLPSSAAWQGCVEARPAPYDITDDPPSTSTPATMFVPFFWPDEGDDDDNNNNWLDESSNIFNVSGNTNVADAQTVNIYKYRTNAAVTINNNSPNQRGPNRGCPTPIVPLTNDRNTILTGIAAMRHWNGGGTNQAEGLAWGWRVLSPGAPFTQGRAYNDPNDPVHKVLVLMTDGENTSLSNGNNAFQSDYSAYQFRRLWSTYQSAPAVGSPSTAGIPNSPTNWRRPISSSSSFVDYINDREEDLCDAIKAAGIEIYTIQFRDTNSDNEQRLEGCASPDVAGRPRHSYTAADAEELNEAFAAIGTGIGHLRITQ